MSDFWLGYCVGGAVMFGAIWVSRWFASQGHFGTHRYTPEWRVTQLEGENAALREALTEAHARMVYLFQALPFEQRHRWGGDVAEFIEGIDAGRGEQQAP